MLRVQITCCATLLAAIFSSIATADSASSNAGTSFTGQPRKITVDQYASWMARLPDNALLSRMSLPGTHNSCALHDGISFGFAKCQTWQLADQLNAGIRFLDIRCRHVDDTLRIYHRIIDQHLSFQEVRDICRTFLKTHPTECIVMSLNQESTAKHNTRTFAETFAAITENDAALWHVGRKTPRLNTVRGKIVLVDRVSTLGGLRWGEMQLQDQYKAPLSVKAKLIRSHLERASKATRGQWYINFCSGTRPSKWRTPRKSAIDSNAVALEFLQRGNRPSPCCLGTVVMDFPGDELIARLIESNFSP